jgi:hypothetical protein
MAGIPLSREQALHARREVPGEKVRKLCAKAGGEI